MEPALGALLAGCSDSGEPRSAPPPAEPARGCLAEPDSCTLPEDNDMEVRGHTLVWDQAYLDSTPEWVLAVTDPEELRVVLRDAVSMLQARSGGMTSVAKLITT